jgi:hypothetical protein
MSTIGSCLLFGKPLYSGHLWRITNCPLLEGAIGKSYKKYAHDINMCAYKKCILLNVSYYLNVFIINIFVLCFYLVKKSIF